MTGGGNLFKIRLSDGVILKTDPSGIHEQMVADNFDEFLVILYKDWVHFRDEDHNWNYISG